MRVCRAREREGWKGEILNILGKKILKKRSAVRILRLQAWARESRSDGCVHFGLVSAPA